MARDLNLLVGLMVVFSLSAAHAAGPERARPAAESLGDPTRPPAQIGGAPGMDASKVPAGPVLQSVLISPGRKSAIISGAQVALGEKYGDARLTRLTENEAVLEGPQGTTVLKLAPKVEKKAATVPRAGQTGAWK